MNSKRIRNLLIGCVILLSLLCYGLYEQNTRQQRDRGYYPPLLPDTITYYVSKQGNTVAEKKINVMDEKTVAALKQENEQLRQQLKLFNHVQSVTEIVTDNTVAHVSAPLHDTIPCDFTPVCFAVDSPFFKLSGEITTKNISFDSIAFPNCQTIIVGEKRTGMLKKNDWVVSVENTNPFLHVIGLNNITLQPERHWYQSGWLKFAVGAAVGIAIVKW